MRRLVQVSTTRALAPRWVLAALPVLVLAALGALAASGAAASSSLADAGALVQWATPVVAALNRLAGATVLGGLVLLLLVLSPPRARTGAQAQPEPDDPARAWRRAASVVAWAGPIWAVVNVVELLFQYAAAAGRPIGGAEFGGELAFYLTEIPAGRTELVAAILIAVTALGCVAIADYRSAALAALPAFAVLFARASSGHAAGRTDHDLAVGAMLVHLFGAAVWVGGLVVLCLVARRGASLAVLARRYSTIAGCCFILVGASGVLTAWLRMNEVADLSGPYGRLLVAKVILFVLVGGFGWWHRRRTIDRLHHSDRPFGQFAAGQILVLAATFGVSSALATTPPPRDLAAALPTLPAEEVSGRPLPGPPEPGAWLTAFAPDLVLAVAVLALAGGYLFALRRVHRRGLHWPGWRIASYLAGVVLLGWGLLGGVAVYGNLMVSAHLSGIFLLTLVVPALLVLGAPGELIHAGAPGRSDGSRGPAEWLAVASRTGLARRAAHPVTATVHLGVALVLWLFTPLLSWALSSYLGGLVMTGHLAVAGYIFVHSLIGPDHRASRPSHLLRALSLGAVAALLAGIGVLLARMQILLAADYFGALGLPWGVDALADQGQGAIAVWAVGGLGVVLIGAVLMASWVREEDREANRAARLAARRERQARAADAGDDELEAYEKMISRRVRR